MVSFGAEREAAVAGAFLEPAWCIQLTAEVRDKEGRPVKGVPVSFYLDRRTGHGRVLGASLSHQLVLTDERGSARILLVSSDLPERCRCHAVCGTVSLGAGVDFVRRRPRALVVGPAPAERPGPEELPWSPEAELDARVARLVRALGKGGRSAERVRAEITAMGRGAVGPLLRMIYDENRPATERRLAAKALAAVKDELVLDRLLKNLDDRRAAVRRGAEEGLFERGAGRAGKGVRRVALLAGPFGRASALRLLAAWGRPEDVALLAARAGADGDPLVRATAAWKLKAFQDRAEARVALRAAMDDKSAFVRYSAAKAQGLVPAVSGRRRRPLLPAGAAGDRDPRVRAAVARAGKAPDCSGLLLKLTADRDVRVRRAATESLGHMPASDVKARGRLHELARDRDRHTADLAFGALVRGGSFAAAGHMLEALGRRDRTLAGVALESLERVYRVELGRPRFGALPSAELIGEWTRWVRACRNLRPVERLWLAAERKDSRLRGEATLALVRHPAAGVDARRRAATLAAAMVRSDDVRVRPPACAALWQLGDASGREKLLEDLASRDWPRRYAACRAAAFVRDRRVALMLVGLLGERSAAMRVAAHRSLLTIRGRGEDPGFDPEGPPEGRRRAAALWKKWAEALKIRGPRAPRGKDQ
jgi:HEAT repeat protein